MRNPENLEIYIPESLFSRIAILAVVLAIVVGVLTFNGCQTTPAGASALDLNAVVVAQVGLVTIELTVEDLYAAKKIGPKTYTDLRAVEAQTAAALDLAAAAAKAGQPLTREQQLGIAQGFLVTLQDAIRTANPLPAPAATQPH